MLTGRELVALESDEGFGRLAGLHERTVFGRYPVTAGEAAAAVEVATRLAAAAAPGPTHALRQGDRRGGAP